MHRKVLIIDDDPLGSKLFLNRFLVENYHVEVAESGTQGLAILHSLQPDLLLLDLQLPDMDGVEILRKVRQHPDFQHLPVIVLSGTYMSSLFREAWKAGANRCLSKSDCNPKQLFEIAIRLLNEPASASPALFSQNTTGPAPLSETQTAPPASTSVQSLKTDPIPEKEEATNDTPQPGDPLQTLLEKAPALANPLLRVSSTLKSSPGAPVVIEALQSVEPQLSELISLAQAGDAWMIADYAEAIQGLVKELLKSPQHLKESPLLTLQESLERLPRLCRRLDPLPPPPWSGSQALILIHDLLTRRAVSIALQKTGMQTKETNRLDAAQEVLQSHPLRLIFLGDHFPQQKTIPLAIQLQTSARPPPPRVLVLALTENFRSLLHETAQKPGFSCMTQPFSLAEIRLKVMTNLLLCTS